jgi:ATP-dependent DNA helicase RecG
MHYNTSMPTEPTPIQTDPLQETAQYVKGVGPSRYALLQKMELHTVGDLLFNFPRAYEDVSDCRAIVDLEPGVLQTVVGEIIEMDSRTTGSGKTMISVVITDGKQVLEGVWFNQAYVVRSLRYGQRVAFSGKPSWRADHWQIGNPRVRPLDQDAAEQGNVIPVYSLTDGLYPEQIRKIQKQIVETYAGFVPEALPDILLQKHQLVGIKQALQDVHLPARVKDADEARRRLVYEEFLILQVALALRRRDARTRLQAPAMPVSQKIDERIRQLFSFQLTGDQNRAISQICKDMAQDRPMRRLLQADVGAGKTAVAVYAMLLAVAWKHQVALMAPTEVLARQHWRTLHELLAHSRVRRSLLIGSLSEKEKKITHAEIRHGQVDLVVGTQALIQKEVEFARLGLVVIDEQHRFGVTQRAQFKQLGVNPHYLIMTATPIPRTIALTVFSDLDVSVMREMPPGRKKVVTRWINEEKREKLFEKLCEEMRLGRQLYVVCPLVEESEDKDTKAAEQTFKELKEGIFRGFEVGLLHGRLDDKAKDFTMNQFRRGELNVLVTTTVVEVGVDIPNATLMVIEHADRFGMSQLHQLRGRITRGPVAGECYLFADAPNDETKERLQTLCKTTDGFELAEYDLRVRGMGEFFGTKQHGLGELKLGNLVRDADLLSFARNDALELVQGDPGLKLPEHAELRKQVLAKYGQKLALAEIG